MNNELRLGELNYNKFNNRMEIIEYKNFNDIIVKFSDGSKRKTTYQHFKEGNIVSKYDKTIMNVGYLGEGKYKPIENGYHSLNYKTWRSMLDRCYNENFHKKETTYEKCEVCEKWHNFQNFSKWFEENYYKIEGEKTHLDKDILNKGNKLYSPETCIFVPQRINKLFIKSNKSRGKYPIGVTLHKGCNNFCSRCSILDENNNIIRKEIGYFKTIEEAFLAYKTFKEQYIKQVADEYKDKIPKKLYDAMYNYKVEITD